MRQGMIEQIEVASREKPEHVGVKVGLLCLRGQVPLSLVQGIVGTTHVSVYRWVTGKTTPQNKADVRKLQRLAFTLTAAIEQGVLPAEGKFDSALILPFWKLSKDNL